MGGLKIKIPKFTKSTYSLKLKKNKTVTAAAKMKNVSDDARIFYSTDKPEVATVDEKGVITAVGKGNAVLCANVNGIDYTAKMIVK